MVGTIADEGPDCTGARWLQGGGEMGALVRAYDWSTTPLGPTEFWPQSLQTAVSTCLHCSFPILIWWGPELIKIYNDAYRPMLGCKHPKALGQRGEDCWREIWHIIGPMLRRVLDQGEATPADDLLLMLERSGYPEECYFSFSYSPIYDETHIGGVFCPVIETTDKVIGARRLETLRRLAALPRAEDLGSACRQAVAVLSANDRDVPFALLYLLEDDGKTAQLAATAGLQVGGPEAPAELDLAQSAGWPLARAVNQPVVLQGLADRVLPSGAWSRPPEQAYLAPIILPGNQRAAVLVIGLNPHKQLDRAYQSFLDLASAHIGSAIADTLAYEAERKRAEALAELDRAKTTFFSNVSHEFRTPLTLMLGPIEDMLRDATGELPEGCKKQLQVVHRNSLRLLRLVNTMLDFSRIEAGRARANYRPIDLAAYTADLASSFRSACERAGLELRVDCPPLPQGATTYVDREMWEKIVLNLLSNAFKFTLKGAIEVGLQTTDKEARLIVRDTGVGIPAEELPRMFERFHRIPHTQGRTHEGTGIGLALVQELVKLHGGKVSVESEVNKGSCFTVSIPFGSSHLDPQHICADTGLSSTATGAITFVEEALRWLPETDRPAEIASMIHAQAAQPYATGPRPRIIWADDNADMRAYVTRLLSPRCDVEAFADGQAALEAALDNPPDLVLTDVMMPRLDGFGLLRALRASPATAECAAILLSARAGEENRVEGMQAGADDYIVKPFSAPELIARVEAHATMARMRRETNLALRHRTEQLETLINKAPVGVYLVDSDFRLRTVNPVALPVFGDIPGGVMGRDFGEILHILWHKDYADEVENIFRHTLETGEPYVMPERVEPRLDRGQTEYYEWRVDRIVLPEGRYGVVCYFRDVSAQVQARHVQQLLIDELNHRVKNTLASVQAIVHHTLRNTRNPADFAASFTGRIQSMSRVHSLLTNAAWKGADLHHVIEDQLLLGPIDQTRLTVRGPAVNLEPQEAQHIAMMLHELATNSVKYGALGTPQGSVTISWTVAEGMLRLTWQEQGGPRVSGPIKRGFGSTLIEQSARSSGGDARMTIAQDGISWEITFPLARSMPMQATGRPEHPELSRQDAPVTDAPPVLLAGKRLLVVEDEPLVALDLAAGLADAGAEVAGPASTAEDALRIIESMPLDGALLDANLHGQPVDDIAQALTRRHVPFVFVSGYGRQSLPQGFANAALLPKPFSKQQLIEAAARLNVQRTVRYEATPDEVNRKAV